MELDHLIVFTTADAPEVARLEALGLTPSYRRTHAGQGTANACFCFENAYLEILWVTYEAETRSAPVARLQLAARAQWRTGATNPFGIAWRPTMVGERGPPCWPCTPPYLPAGAAIAVATASDDLSQPLLFSFPGSLPPRDWPPARRGNLQAAGGFGRLEMQTLRLPNHGPTSPALHQVAAALGAGIETDPCGSYANDVTLTCADGTSPRWLRFPDCDWLP